MVTPAKKILQSAVIDSIKNRQNLNYSQIAESIDVHVSHIQKVSKGNRQLSQEKFEQLCKHWGVDLHDLVQQLELDEAEYLRRKTLQMVIRAREINLNELSQKTGISILHLNQIERGKRELTEEDLELISEVLDIDSKIIDEGLLAIVMELIQKGLQYIHLESSAIDAVVKFIEGEI